MISCIQKKTHEVSTQGPLTLRSQTIFRSIFRYSIGAILYAFSVKRDNKSKLCTYWSSGFTIFCMKISIIPFYTCLYLVIVWWGQAVPTTPEETKETIWWLHLHSPAQRAQTGRQQRCRIGTEWGRVRGQRGDQWCRECGHSIVWNASQGHGRIQFFCVIITISWFLLCSAIEVL